MNRLHKRFTDEQIKVLFQGYCQGMLGREEVQQMLGIGTRVWRKHVLQTGDVDTQWRKVQTLTCTCDAHPGCGCGLCPVASGQRAALPDKKRRSATPSTELRLASDPHQWLSASFQALSSAGKSSKIKSGEGS